MMEKRLNQFTNLSLSSSIVLMIVLSLFKVQNVFLGKLTILLFSFSLFSLSLWTILGTIYRWKSFRKAYKRIDFERYFGGFGSFIYLTFGILGCIASVFIIIYTLFKINHL